MRLRSEPRHVELLCGRDVAAGTRCLLSLRGTELAAALSLEHMDATCKRVSYMQIF